MVVLGSTSSRNLAAAELLFESRSPAVSLAMPPSRSLALPSLLLLPSSYGRGLSAASP